MPKTKNEVKHKFKMVNTLRLGLSKFDEVITPEVNKIKKALVFADNQSQASCTSKAGSVADPEGNKYVRVFKNDLGSQVEVEDPQPIIAKPRLEEKELPKPAQEEDKQGLFGNYSFARSQDEGSKESAKGGLASYKFSVAQPSEEAISIDNSKSIGKLSEIPKTCKNHSMRNLD